MVQLDMIETFFSALKWITEYIQESRIQLPAGKECDQKSKKKLEVLVKINTLKLTYQSSKQCRCGKIFYCNKYLPERYNKTYAEDVRNN